MDAPELTAAIRTVCETEVNDRVAVYQQARISHGQPVNPILEAEIEEIAWRVVSSVVRSLGLWADRQAAAARGRYHALPPIPHPGAGAGD